jgi:hypothetical protein
MNINLYSRSLRRPRSIAITLLFALSGLGTAVASEDEGGTWRAKPGVSLRSVTHYFYKEGRSTTYPALGASLGVEFVTPAPAFAAGLFADYELAMHRDQANIRLVGGWTRYRLGRWELSATGAHFATSRNRGLWMYMNRLEFQPRHGHRIALEAMGSMVHRGKPALQILYETDLTSRVSLSLKAGLGSNRLQDFGTSMHFAWNLR